MRRRDREETRREEIINIIAAADCCRLGLINYGTVSNVCQTYTA